MDKRKIEKIYVNDFDGNIIHTPTPILLEEKQWNDSWKTIELSILEYDHNPLYQSDNYRFLNDKSEDSFQHMRDFYDSDFHKWPLRLQHDILQALEGNTFAPSFEKFKQEVLIEGNLFSLNTARGNTPDNFHFLLKKINTIVLSKEEKEIQIENIKKRFSREKDGDKDALEKYFDLNTYLPVSNREVCKFLHIDLSIWSALRKTLAMDRYINYVTKIIAQYQNLKNQPTIKLWFSDDWYQNIETMLWYFLAQKNLWKAAYNFFDYRLYYTGKSPELVQLKIEEYLYTNLNQKSDTISFDLQSSQKNTNKDILKISVL